MKARVMLAESLGVSPAVVPDDASMETFDRWDSLAHMRIILALEAALVRPLETEEMLAVIDLESLQRLLDVS